MKIYSCYMYPITSRGKEETSNPYIKNLVTHLSRYINVVNRHKPSDIGVFDFFKYLQKINFVFFNWIEDLPDHKFGYVQALVLCLVIFLRKMLKIKIVWIMHNKVSHFEYRSSIKKSIYRILCNKSDVIFTHAREGIEFGEKINPDIRQKISLINHPIENDYPIKSLVEKKYDILIWGTITIYKGILEFLSYCIESKTNYSIMIAGKFQDIDYYRKVQVLKSENITIINKFIEDEQLYEYIQLSRIVLFTYNPASVLSSGALMFSLPFPVVILGPNVGSFKDLAEEGLILAYEDFKQMNMMISNILNTGYNTESMRQKRETFLKKNTWSIIANKMYSEIKNRIPLS